MSGPVLITVRYDLDAINERLAEEQRAHPERFADIRWTVRNRAARESL